MAKLNCVTVLAPAKLNLALDVVGLLPNGYHNLDMTMQAITLYERVVLRRSQNLSLTLPGSPVAANDSNTAIKAALAFFHAVSTVCAEVCVAGVSPVFPFVSSPFLLAVNTLSVPSFLTVTRERFCLSPLRSSFNLSAATFLVAPAIACSSRIL